ncbi:MAG: ISAs1 family transposase [Methylococcaceae bacterium]
MARVEGFREQTDGEVIAVDGKTSRGSKNLKQGKSPLLLVSAWTYANRQVLGQEINAENRTKTLQFHCLELKGFTVTIDAMGCQAAIAKQMSIRRVTMCWD